MLFSLAGTGLAVIGGQDAPAPALSALVPFATTPRSGDPTVTVRTVSAVDQFESVDAVSGELVRVRVAGIRSTTSCWQADSLNFARDVLQDKKVRLIVNAKARTSDGPLPARVLLPEGQDFALAALAAGAALAGATEVDPRLLAAETDARANRRGLWANSCAPSQVRPSTSELPLSTTTSPPPSSDDTTASPPAPTDPTTTTATTTPSPPADVQQDARAGRLCSPEGATGVNDNDREFTCTRTLTGSLRWAAR